MIIINFYEILGKVHADKEDGIKSQVLSYFLASSLNIELVYIILAGITRFSHEYKVKLATQEIWFEKDESKEDQSKEKRKSTILTTTLEDSFILLS